MKIISLITIIFITMTNPIRVDFIGQNVNNIHNAILSEKYSDDKRNWYVIEGDFVFFGKSYEELGLIADKNNILHYYTFFISSEIDRGFYDAINEQYGFPTGMYVTEAINTYTEYAPDGVEALVSDLAFKECLFEDNPKKLVWDKKNYSITISMVTEGLYQITIGKEFDVY